MGAGASVNMTFPSSSSFGPPDSPANNIVLSMDESTTSPTGISGFLDSISWSPSGTITNTNGVSFGAEAAYNFDSSSNSSTQAIAGQEFFTNNNGTTASLTELIGQEMQTNNNFNAVINLQVGVQEETGNWGTSTVANIVGGSFKALNANTGKGTASTGLFGLVVNDNSSGGGTITTAVGVEGTLGVGGESNTGTITTAYDLLANTPFNAGAGTIGKMVGVEINNMCQTGVTTCYGIENGTTGQSYFAGPLNAQGIEVGTETSPTTIISANAGTCTTGSITPSSSAGGFVGGTCAVRASTTGHNCVANASDGSVQGNVIPQCSVVGTTATVTLTSILAGSPTAKTYNVTVF
jgi:hypothetical protein